MSSQRRSAPEGADCPCLVRLNSPSTYNSAWRIVSPQKYALVHRRFGPSKKQNSGGGWSVLVHLATVIEYHRMGWVINIVNSFLIVLEAGSLKITIPAWSSSGEGPVLGCRMLTSPCGFTWLELSQTSFIRALTPL